MNASNATPAPPRVIAAFDFDGTLTTHDSFFHFLREHRAIGSFAADLVLTSPLLLAYALQFVDNEAHKMALFSRAFTGLRSTASNVSPANFPSAGRRRISVLPPSPASFSTSAPATTS